MRPLSRLAVLAAAATLTACSALPPAPSSTPQVGDSIADHPIGAFRDTRTLHLDADGAGGIRENPDAVRAFVVDHARAGEGPMVVSAAPGDLRAAFRAMLDAGARPEDLRAAPTDGATGATLTFAAWRAEPPKCGEMASDGALVGLAAPSNDSASDWGCATQRDLALMLVHPRDAVARRGDLPSADAEAPTGRVQDTRNYARPERPTTVQTN
jgi:type IV pilus biogenesis protein CpaD/CtpE